jgi:hypothetical protein
VGVIGFTAPLFSGLKCLQKFKADFYYEEKNNVAYTGKFM